MLKVAGRILNVVVWSGITILVLLMFVFPAATSLLIQFDYYPAGKFWNGVLRVLQQSQVVVMYVFCWIWIFFVGSCFASFLNVVAWRIPRGKSILGSSHCPQCNIRLNFRNNLPVLGWMRNGGKCANCELPIPVRYLIAELVLGATFLILFLAETASGGITIPFRTPNQFAGIENVLFAPQADLLIMLGYHLTLLSLIFTLAIAATEKFAAPISIVFVGIVAAFGIQCALPPPGIVDFRFADHSNESISSPFLYLLESPAQFAIAIGLGIVASYICFQAIRFASHVKPCGGFACLLLIGIWLGWQSVLSVTLIYFLFSPLKSVNTCGRLLVATLVHLCLWRLQTHCQWWPGPASGLRELLLASVYIGVLAIAIRTLISNSEKSEPTTTIDLSNTINDLK